MTDTSNGRVGFEAAGNQHYLQFTLNSFCAFQEKAGLNIITAFAKMDGENLDFVMLRRLFWAALEHEELTERAAGVLASELGLEGAFEKLTTAIELAVPSAPKDDDAEKPVAAAKARITLS